MVCSIGLPSQSRLRKNSIVRNRKVFFVLVTRYRNCNYNVVTVKKYKRLANVLFFMALNWKKNENIKRSYRSTNDIFIKLFCSILVVCFTSLIKKQCSFVLINKKLIHRLDFLKLRLILRLLPINLI